LSAIEAIRLARESGVHLGVAGDDLILDADREPTPRVLAAIRRHKAGIVALLTAVQGDWTAEDWRVFYDERAGIGEHDSGLSHDDAERQGFRVLHHGMVVAAPADGCRAGAVRPLWGALGRAWTGRPALSHGRRPACVAA
jgi:hypothetical protein